MNIVEKSKSEILSIINKSDSLTLDVFRRNSLGVNVKIPTQPPKVNLLRKNTSMKLKSQKSIIEENAIEIENIPKPVPKAETRVEAKVETRVEAAVEASVSVATVEAQVDTKKNKLVTKASTESKKKQLVTFSKEEVSNGKSQVSATKLSSLILVHNNNWFQRLATIVQTTEQPPAMRTSIYWNA